MFGKDKNTKQKELELFIFSKLGVYIKK